jgi:hypothetical protein
LDSAAGTTYILNQSNQTGQKMQMNYIFRKDAPGAPDGPPEPGSFRTFHFDGGGAGGGMVTSQEMVIVKGMDSKAIAAGKAESRVLPDNNVKKEVLASQIMEGVTCEGVRLTSTIEAGAIGNDRPIQSIEERWYSPDLQVNLLVRKTDPRTGEATVRLTNVRRLEPDPSLFTVPPGYQIK